MKTIDSIKEELLHKPFFRDPSKKQYKIIEGRRYPVLCSCNAIGGYITCLPNFGKKTFISLGTKYGTKGDGRCPKCNVYSFIDLTTEESTHG